MADSEIPGNGRLLARIDERTVRLDEKIDSHIETLKVMIMEAEAREAKELDDLKVELCKQVIDHEQRIRKLEGGVWIRDGLAAVAGAVTGFVAGLQR